MMFCRANGIRLAFALCGIVWIAAFCFVAHWSHANHATEKESLFLVSVNTLDNVSEAGEIIRTSVSRPIKIVAMSDFRYAPVAKMWYDRLTALGYNEHVVVATDAHALTWFQNQSYRVDYYPVDLSKGYTLGLLWKARIQYWLENIQNGTHLLTSDVDAIFARHVPLDTLVGESPHDVIHSYGAIFPRDVYRAQGFVVCGGLMLLKSNSNTMRFLSLVLEECNRDVKNCDDQRIINRLYLHTMNWTTSASAARTTCGYDRYACSTETSLQVAIWNHTFAWRGPKSEELQPSDCPRTDVNWVAMPRSRKLPRAKIALYENWEKACG